MALVTRTLTNGSLVEFDFYEDDSDFLVLKIDGRLQSSINLKNPGELLFTIHQRVKSTIESVFFPNQGITSLTLGGGAYSIPRYIESCRPSSKQTVIEINQELIDFVEGTAPLNKNSLIKVVCADAYEEVINSEDHESYDFVFLDVFVNLELDSNFLSTEFIKKLNNLVSKGGLVVMNIIDDIKMHKVTTQIKNIIEEPDVEKIVISSIPAATKEGIRTGNKNFLLSYRKKY